MKTNYFMLGCAGLMAYANVNAQTNNQIKNVLFIAVDDMKPLLSCYGDETAITPNLDRLASQSVVFHSAYCQEAISAATRASLLTGWCPDRTRVRDLKTLIRDMNPDVVTLPQFFRQEGWQVTGIGKIYDYRSVDNKKDAPSWDNYLPTDKERNAITNGQYYGWYAKPENVKVGQKLEAEARRKGAKGYAATAQSLKKFKPSTECADVPDEYYIDGVVTKLAVDYINNYAGSKPLFFAVGYQRPHLPFVAPKKYWDMYDANTIPLAKFRQKAANSPDCAYHNSPELQSYTDIPALISFSDINNVILPEKKERELIHGYYACVSFIDAQVGRLLDALEKKNMMENTAIVFWGDHGWHLGDHGLWNKHTNFEDATRVPFMVYVPGAKHQEINAPVEFLDIYPTLCDLVNSRPQQDLHGTSLMPIITGQQKSVKEYAVSQYPRKGLMGYSLRSERYRYTIWVKHDKTIDRNQVVAEELYDYKKDPLETKNVIEEKSYRKAAAQMRMYWSEYKSSVRGQYNL